MLNDDGTVHSQARYYPYGAERWSSGTLPTDYRFTGQRDAGVGLYHMGARWYDAYINQFVSPDPIIPQPGNPQSLNRYSYSYNNPVKFRDPSGHQATEADDAACWERRWFQAHGYEFSGGEWIYTGNYVFADRLAFEEALANIVLGQHQVGNVASLSFVDGPLTYSLVQRGQDTTLSKALGSVAFAMDIVDTAITGGVALAYTIEQIATAAIGGPPGAAVGYVIGEGVNKGTGAFLLVVDLTGLGFIGTADWAAGRTGVDFGNRQAWIGLDTIASMTTLGTSAGGQILLPVTPGVYVALAGDVAQLIYDFAREARLPGYSLQVQWQ